MPGIHLGHVCVVTADLDRFTRFYEHTIGLRLVAVDHSPQAGYERLGVFADANAVALLALERPDLDLGSSPDGDRPGMIDHLTFKVDGDEFEVAVARLVEAGASDGTIHPTGPTDAVRFDDPDGRTWSLWRPNPDWQPPASVEFIGCATGAGQEIAR